MEHMRLIWFLIKNNWRTKNIEILLLIARQMSFKNWKSTANNEALNNIFFSIQIGANFLAGWSRHFRFSVFLLGPFTKFS